LPAMQSPLKRQRSVRARRGGLFGM